MRGLLSLITRTVTGLNNVALVAIQHAAYTVLSEDLNGNGKLDANEDLDGNGALTKLRVSATPFNFAANGGYGLSRVANQTATTTATVRIPFTSNFFAPGQDHKFSNPKYVQYNSKLKTWGPTAAAPSNFTQTKNPNDPKHPEWDLPTIVNGDFETPGTVFRGNSLIPGWQHHGAPGGNASVAVNSQTGNHYFKLSTPIFNQASNQLGIAAVSLAPTDSATRTHNWLYVPNEAHSLSFDLRRISTTHGAFPPNQLKVFLGTTELTTTNILLDGNDLLFHNVTLAIPQPLYNTIQTLTFVIQTSGGQSLVQQTVVEIDNVKFQ